MIVIYVYRALLRLYPHGYRQLFAAEMAGVFAQAAAEHRQQGLNACIRFVMAEVLGVVKGAAVEWMRTPARRGHNTLVLRKPSEAPADVIASAERVNALVARVVHAIAHHDFETARSCSHDERTERQKLRTLQQKYGIAE